MSDFKIDSDRRVAAAAADLNMRDIAAKFFEKTIIAKYSYNFFWLGRPIIQYPQDIVAFQEIVWQVQPDVIIETGIAHGGSLILSASLLAMLDLCDATLAGETLDPTKPRRRVIGVDIDIRSDNRLAIEKHPLSRRITMFEGSSVDPLIVDQVRAAIDGARTVLVALDSNHTHDHVLAELHAYAPMVTTGSYCLVFDTVIEDLPETLFADRPWAKGNNAKTAVRQFLKQDRGFKIDKSIESKLLITVAPDGFLRRVSPQT
jgi:cephalosporin hydroxylase